MEIQPVYQTDWANDDERHSFRSVISSWSSINQLAFTSDGSTETSETGSKKPCGQSFIHIVDPNKPWDIHSISSGHVETITHLQWHPSGCYLLSADRIGVFKLWSMKNNLVNDWQCERTVLIGEKPVCFSWLGTLGKFLFCDAPKDLNHLMAAGNSQNFPRNKVRHPLASFYGTSRDGWLVVTETGKVCFVSMNPEVAVAKIQIDTELQGIQAGDIAFSTDSVEDSLDHGRKHISNGHVILGLADGLVGSVAKFYKVSLHRISNSCSDFLSAQYRETGCSDFLSFCEHQVFCLANFIPGLQQIISSNLQGCWVVEGPSPSMKYAPLCQTIPSPLVFCFAYAITHIKFVYRNSGSHVLIFNKGLLESCIERWHLNREAQQLHELCLKQQPHRKPPPIKTWKCICKHTVKKHIASLAVPWLPVDPEKMQSYAFPRHNLIIGFADGHLRALNSWSLEIEGELKSFDHLTTQSNQPKRIRASFCGHSAAFLTLHYSPCSCCIMGITGDGSMYLFKCQPTKAISHLQVPMAVVNLLEYCTMSSWDWWDIMVTIKHQHEDILEATLRLFEQNCKNLQHAHISSKYLTIKAGLLSLYASSETRVIDCYSKQFLLAVGNFFKSLIPTVDDRLAAICQQVGEVELENLFQSLDLREFEIDVAILKTLHPLAQWVADCCVILLGILVQQGRESVPAPGAALLQDNQCVLLLKQLVLLILIWAKKFPGILPNCVVQVEKVEYLMHLFKIICKLWMVNHQALDRKELEGAASELQPFFFNHLNFLYQSLVLSPSNKGVTGRHAYLKPGEADEYEFGRKPRDRMLPLKLLTTQYSGNVDIVRKQFLGNIPDEKLRQCTKCEGVSLMAQTSENSTENAWEQRWIKTCICGGAWKRLHGN